MQPVRQRRSLRCWRPSRCSERRAASRHRARRPHAGNGMTISFKTIDEPAKGANKIEAVVKQDGKPVTDATVAVTFRMPAMPNMNMPERHSRTPLTHESNGRYVGTGQLEMAGSWNVAVTVSRNGTHVASSRF